MARKPLSLLSRTCLLAFAGWVLLFGTGNAFGQVKTLRDISSSVSPGSTVTYSDLLKVVFTDLSPDDGTAHQTIPIRHVSGDHERMPLHGDFKIDSFEVLRLRDPQGPVIVIEVDVTTDDDDRATVYGSESSIVAAFRVSPSVKLLDALDVKEDRFTGIKEKQSTIPVSGVQTAFFVSNGHDNSNQTYELISGFFIRNDRLEPLFGDASQGVGKPASADLFLLSDRLFDSKSMCEVSHIETVAFLPSAQPGHPYFKMGVRIQVATTAEGDECRAPRKYSRYYHGAWVWDASRKRFRPAPGGNLDRLDKFNRL